MSKYKELSELQRTFLYELFEAFDCKNVTQLGELLGFSQPSAYDSTMQKFMTEKKDRFLVALLKIQQEDRKEIAHLEHKLDDLDLMDKNLSKVDDVLSDLTNCSG